MPRAVGELRGGVTGALPPEMPLEELFMLWWLQPTCMVVWKGGKLAAVLLLTDLLAIVAVPAQLLLPAAPPAPGPAEAEDKPLSHGMSDVQPSC
jgi:hypothetical protein